MEVMAQPQRMRRKVGRGEWEYLGEVNTQGRRNTMWKSLDPEENIVLWKNGNKFCMAGFIEGESLGWSLCFILKALRGIRFN